LLVVSVLNVVPLRPIGALLHCTINQVSVRRQLDGDGGAYRMLLVALIEAERLPCGSIPGFSMTPDE
jgi:hypothetical protein